MRRLALLIIVFTAICGCKTVTKYVPEESVRTEYRDVVCELHVTDSVSNDRFVYVKGDSVLDIRWRDRWHTVTSHDTLYIERNDTVRIPYPVERKLSRWEQYKMDLGGIAIGAMAVSVVFLLLYVVIWLKKKFRR